MIVNSQGGLTGISVSVLAELNRDVSNTRGEPELQSESRFVCRIGFADADGS